MSRRQNWWRKLIGRPETAAEAMPKQVLVAHLRELAQRSAPRSAGALRVLDERGEERVAVEAGLTGLKRVEIFCVGPNAFSVQVGSGCFLDSVDTPEEVKRRRVQLTELSLLRASESKDFSVELEGDMSRLPERVAERVEQILVGLFEWPQDAFYSVAIERARRLDSEALLDSFRELAAKRDMETRRVVYQNIINSYWIVPFRATPDVLALAEVEAWPEPLGGQPVWAVFSDHDALEDVRTLDLPFEIVSGISVVRAAVRRKLGALKMNPKSKVGGELYAGELQTLSDYLDKVGVR